MVVFSSPNTVTEVAKNLAGPFFRFTCLKMPLIRRSCVLYDASEPNDHQFQ